MDLKSFRSSRGKGRGDRTSHSLPVKGVKAGGLISLSSLIYMFCLLAVLSVGLALDGNPRRDRGRSNRKCFFARKRFKTAQKRFGFLSPWPGRCRSVMEVNAPAGVVAVPALKLGKELLWRGVLGFHIADQGIRLRIVKPHVRHRQLLVPVEELPCDGVILRQHFVRGLQPAD